MTPDQPPDNTHLAHHTEPTAPAATPASTSPPPPRPWRFPRRWLVVSGALASAALAFVLVYSVNFFGGGSLGAIVDPSGKAVARMHAEGAGRGLAYELVNRPLHIQNTSSLPPTDGVYYPIQTGGTLQDIARIFSMPLEDLKTLNPDTPEEHFFGPGSSVCVFRPGVALADVKPGEPDRLYAGVPLMEGPGRRIRRRSRSWGTPWLVNNLDRALTAYGKAFPDGPPIIVSDISRREGGRLPPHHTHRDGRDVDLSYVPIPDKDNGGFLLMDQYTFDVERNWTFLSALLSTNSVELILMDSSLQKLLYTHLQKQGMSPEDLSRIFQYPHGPGSAQGIIRHWDEHRDHVHIRFSCPPGGPPCP
jgi:hypothetical protein